VPESTGIDAARLIREHQVGVWRYLRALGCDQATAEDLTQDTFLAVMQHPFEEYSSAATAAYLRQTAFHLFVSWQRRSGRVVAIKEIEQLSATWVAWAGHDDGDALLNALQDCLKQLPERTRRALDLRFREQRSREQIAEALGMTEHGARNLLQRAKEKLRLCIEGKLR
jgi:RNA polymerase sigma-70 factor (ECF subfamily)